MRCFLVAAAFAAALPMRADELAASIPANAKLVVLANQPLRLAEKLEKLAADSGAPAFPQAPSELLKQAFPDGVVDWKRPAALVINDFDQGAENLVLILTAADPSKPLAKLGGKDADDGAKEFEIQGETMFAAAAAGHLFVSKKAETLKTFRKSGKGFAELLAGDAGMVAEKADAFLYFNVPAAAEELSAKLDDAEKALNGAGEALPKQSLDQMRVMAGGARTLLRDTSRVYAALEIDDAGATLRQFLDLRADSGLGKIMAKDFAAAPAEPFAGIPDRPYIAAAFFDMARMRTAMTAMSALNSADLKDPEIAARFVAVNKSMVEGIAGSSMLWSLEKKKFAQFQRNVLAAGADGAALVAATQEALGLTIAAAAAGEEEAPMGFKFDVKTSKETLAGIEYVRADMTLEGLPEPAASIVEKLVGKPISTLVGIAKDGTLVSLLNLEPGEWLKDPSKFLDNAAAKAATAKLGERPLFALLVDPFGFVEVVKEAIPLPLPIPEHLTKRPNPPAPPLGFSGLATKQGVEYRMRYESATGRALAGQAQQ